MSWEAPDWAPDVADVHALIPQRGGPDGFDEHTRPSASAVQAQIAMAASLIVGEVGEPPEEAHDLARTTVALGAAYRIENSMWPEQQGSPENVISLRIDYHHAVEVLRRKVVTLQRIEAPS